MHSRGRTYQVVLHGAQLQEEIAAKKVVSTQQSKSSDAEMWRSQFVNLKNVKLSVASANVRIDNTRPSAASFASNANRLVSLSSSVNPMHQTTPPPPQWSEWKQKAEPNAQIEVNTTKIVPKSSTKIKLKSSKSKEKLGGFSDTVATVTQTPKSVKRTEAAKRAKSLQKLDSADFQISSRVDPAAYQLTVFSPSVTGSANKTDDKNNVPSGSTTHRSQTTVIRMQNPPPQSSNQLFTESDKTNHSRILIASYGSEQQQQQQSISMKRMQSEPRRRYPPPPPPSISQPPSSAPSPRSFPQSPPTPSSASFSQPQQSLQLHSNPNSHSQSPSLNAMSKPNSPTVEYVKLTDKKNRTYQNGSGSVKLIRRRKAAEAAQNVSSVFANPPRLSRFYDPASGLVQPKSTGRVVEENTFRMTKLPIYNSFRYQNVYDSPTQRSTPTFNIYEYAEMQL